MQASLITRGPPDAQGTFTTQDRTVEIVLPGKAKDRKPVEQLPASEWSSSATASSSSAPAPAALDPHYKPHALAGFSAFGSDEPNEFATFVQGREAWLGNQVLREEVEEDLRAYAEGSDFTEGYMLTTPLSDAFSGLTPSFLELLRDEFAGPKGSVWVSGMISDASDWTRVDNERSAQHRLLNALLSLPSLEELSSMLLPVQPAYAYDPHDSRESGWTRYFRPDMEDGERREAYMSARETGLQGAGTELREPGTLPSLIEQLNWRGNTKIAHLSGMTPVIPADAFWDLKDGKSRKEAVQRVKGSWKDFSVLRAEALTKDGVRPRKPSTAFAQYSIVRGLDFEESQALGPLLEDAVLPLREPFSRWVSLEPPYPLSAVSAPPIYAGLLPSGRPILISRPSHSDPHTSAGLFGLPDTRYPLASSYIVQPETLPILSTFSTTPDARYWLRYLREGVKELRRTRASVLREYTEGEYGVGREGIEEALERVEGLIDAYGGEEEEDQDEGKGEDEDWSATEPKEEEFDFDLE